MEFPVLACVNPARSRMVLFAGLCKRGAAPARAGKPDVGKGGFVYVGKFRAVAVAASDPEECRHVQRDACHFNAAAGNRRFFFHDIPDQVFVDPAQGLAAADMGVLVAADQKREAALLKSVKGHRCRVMVAGKRVAGGVGEPLPALEPECLGAEIEWPAVDKEYAAVHPFHRHVSKHPEERRTAQLLVPEGADLVASRNRHAIEERMVVVTDHGYEPVFFGEIVDEFEGSLRAVARCRRSPRLTRVSTGPKRWENDGSRIYA